ncbi:hypothetical protein FISHEDRAFT_54994 [Fistulina hepatica ATCC 64428]|uniref:Uncharacterized protein n=1 Tax=Fistulina hepatica ATCC 64428 TaxID=1128425 RepID=A0A0D7ASH1_9AGAR|nr:hypothetical protein FISHEDRAFT_54994 [Fistulina hepatica ATCC 64428]
MGSLSQKVEKLYMEGSIVLVNCDPDDQLVQLLHHLSFDKSDKSLLFDARSRYYGIIARALTSGVRMGRDSWHFGWPIDHFWLLSWLDGRSREEHALASQFTHDADTWLLLELAIIEMNRITGYSNLYCISVSEPEEGLVLLGPRVVERTLFPDNHTGFMFIAVITKAHGHVGSARPSRLGPDAGDDRPSQEEYRLLGNIFNHVQPVWMQADGLQNFY